jgi:FAD/FMN-containing dehydrogenase
MQSAFLADLKSLPAELWSVDEAERKHYAHDWTYPEKPNASVVLLPRTKEHVVEMVKLAQKHKIALVPSGGRTGLSGGACALNGEAVLTLTRMNKIHAVDIVSRTVDVEAGAITEAVHEATKAFGLTWPVDFASKGSSTVGGNIATNAGGINVIQYGNTRNWVLGLDVVLASGELITLNGKLEKNNCGPDLREMFIGSEGILGVIVGATLKLAPVVTDKTTVLIGVRDLSAFHRIFEHGRKCAAKFHAFEFFSDSCMNIVSHFSKVPNPLSTPAPWYLLTEWEGENPWFDAVMEMDGFIDGRMAQSSEEAKMMWAFRERIAESVSLRQNPNKNDISVAVNQVPEFLETFGSTLPKRFPEVDFFLYGHLGDGNLHLNTLPKSPSLDWKKVILEINVAVAEITREFHGSISGEHGVGIIKKPYLGYSLTETEMALLRGLRTVFDPSGIMNPGKVV